MVLPHTDRPHTNSRHLIVHSTPQREQLPMWTSEQLLKIRQQCRQDHEQLRQLRKEVRVNGDGTFVIAPSPRSSASASALTSVLQGPADTAASTAAASQAATARTPAYPGETRSPSWKGFRVETASGRGQGYRVRRRGEEEEHGEEEWEQGEFGKGGDGSEDDDDDNDDDDDDNDYEEEDNEGRDLTAEQEIEQALGEEWQARDEARVGELERLKAKVDELEEVKATLSLSLSYMCDYKGNWGRRGGSASSFALLEKRLQELVLDKVELERKNARLIERNKELQKANERLRCGKGEAGGGRGELEGRAEEKRDGSGGRPGERRSVGSARRSKGKGKWKTRG